MYIVPDSNVFLHFTSLDQIDLLAIVDSSEVTIVITQKLLNELDDHKYGPRSGLRGRAQRSLRRIEEWIDNGAVRPSVRVALQSTPGEETFRKHKLNDKSSDDWYIASALEFIHENDQTNIALLSDDYGMRLRASNFSIDTFNLPENYKLPPSDDKLRKENIKLRTQLSELVCQQPKPMIRFQGGSKITVVQIRDIHPEDTSKLELNQNTDSKDEDSKQTLEENSLEVRSHPPKLSRERNPEQARKLVEMVSELKYKLAPTLERMKPLLEIPEEENERYNYEYQEYTNKLELYSQKLGDVSKRIAQIIALNFELYNGGGSIAEDMRILFLLPPCIEWRETNGHELLPSKPSPPQPPRNVMELQRVELFDQIDTRNLFGASRPMIAGSLPYHEYSSSPNVRITECAGQCLEIRIGSCFHNSNIELPEIYTEFMDDSEPSTFQLHFEVKELNTPEVIKGELTVCIEYEGMKSSPSSLDP